MDGTLFSALSRFTELYMGTLRNSTMSSSACSFHSCSGSVYRNVALFLLGSVISLPLCLSACLRQPDCLAYPVSPTLSLSLTIYPCTFSCLCLHPSSSTIFSPLYLCVSTGEGQFGQVWKAIVSSKKFLTEGQQCAVKMIKGNLITNKQDKTKRPIILSAVSNWTASNIQEVDFS